LKNRRISVSLKLRTEFKRLQTVSKMVSSLSKSTSLRKNPQRNVNVDSIIANQYFKLSCKSVI
jgi:hypothetical protein